MHIRILYYSSFFFHKLLVPCSKLYGILRDISPVVVPYKTGRRSRQACPPCSLAGREPLILLWLLVLNKVYDLLLMFLLNKLTRRDFLKIISYGIVGNAFIPESLAWINEKPSILDYSYPDDHVRDYLHKMKNFNKPHNDDIVINAEKHKTFESTVMRLRCLEQFVGHSNFQLLGFDRGLKIARNYSDVGAFTSGEVELMEKIFYTDAVYYGFFGHKHMEDITCRINKREVIKISHSGNYLYKGTPFETYTRIKKSLGNQMVLTSGIRSIMKQFLLFLNKAHRKGGNVSLASRSLAPPGYSYHGISDFDVGQAGFGMSNFTEQFTNTYVYKKLSESGYLKFRYPQKNLLGVRFEPWHIEIFTPLESPV